MADGKVVLIKRTINNIEPPDGWLVSTPFGHLSIDGTKAGRLARLGDVLKWLEGTREWSRERALMFLLDRLPDDAMRHVYRVQPGRDARQVSEVDSFGFLTAKQLEEAKRIGSALAPESQGLGSTEWQAEFARAAPPPCASGSRPASEPGLPALRLLLTCWSKPTAREVRTRADVCTTTMQGKAWQVNYLAVPLLKAFEWWGWGRVAEAENNMEEGHAAPTRPTVDEIESFEGKTFSELVQFRRSHDGARWDDDMRVIVYAEKLARKKKPGAESVAIRMADELDVSVTFLNGLVRRGAKIANEQKKVRAKNG